MPREFGGPPQDIAAAQNVNQAPSSIEKFLPEQEDRDGLVVNRLQNERPKTELSAEQVREFAKAMRERIAQELQREKTTLPKDRLQALDEELEHNPEGVKNIVESFGYGVASDPFMLYGIISRSKDLIKQVVRFHREDNPSISVGAPRPEDVSAEEIFDTLKEFWDTEDLGTGFKDFPTATDINYYSGTDVEMDDEHPRFGHGTAPGYRYIFGPTRKNRSDYASSTRIYATTGVPPRPTGTPIEQGDIDRFVTGLHGLRGRKKVQDYALSFRDFSAALGKDEVGVPIGYPAEWYIPGSGKGKVLGKYFKEALVPVIKRALEKPKGVS